MTTTIARTAAPAAAHADAASDALARVAIDAACTVACAAIAPAWPLDRAIAVNPHWSRIGRPVRTVAARMAMLAGIRVFPARETFAQAWESGRIRPADLDAAIARLSQPAQDGARSPHAVAHAMHSTPASAPLTADACLAALTQPLSLCPLPLLVDVLDDDGAGRTRLPWRQAITHQVSQTCAAYFDEHQADWQPEWPQGLYGFWRGTLTHDHGIGVLMGVPDLSRRLGTLPATREDAERWVLQRVGLPEAVWADYLESVLLTVQGWASWCAYLSWQANLDGRTDTHLRDLLAIRLAWGAIVLECADGADATLAFANLRAAWQDAPARLARAEAALRVDEAWQLAMEIGYQRELAAKLTSTAAAVTATAGAVASPGIEAQAVFCIDVRSEPMRRALEATSPAIRTHGFAGFFGLPVAYTPLGTLARRPQLPGLLPAAMEVTDRLVSADDPERSAGADLEDAARRARRRRFAGQASWLDGSRWPGAAFSFVESAGLSYLGKLGQWLRPSTAARGNDDHAGLPARLRPLCRPALAGLDLNAKVALAAKLLHVMGLEQGLAPMVLLVGHGSQSANNAHAAALDCGACCGQTGEVNARALARLLNEPAVRAGLRGQGIEVPVGTVFVAALHNTTTDEIEGHDIDLLPAGARERWARLAKTLDQAGDRVRRERAGTLGLDAKADAQALFTTLRRRANDGAQTRPEWGLAGNAAFVIAPRARTRGVSLDGRAFLHDYDAAQDTDGGVLELLMTAPMLVTHWINWQYHASTCEPLRLGSGNKLLHNVVGGRIGVFEGNGGDLRIGLSRQSLHDGERWVHEPLRLTVAIDAPARRIEAIIGKHAVVRQLLDNGWLHLWRFADEGLHRYECGQWLAP